MPQRERDAVSAYTARIGKLTERYVLQLIASAHQGAQAARRRQGLR